MGGGIPPGVVATHAALPVAEGSVVVVDVTELRLHESMVNKEWCVADSDGATAVTAVQTGVLAIMERRRRYWGVRRGAHRGGSSVS